MNNFDQVASVEELYRPMLNSLGFGVCMLDRSGHVVVWNKWMARHTLVPASRALGSKFSDVLARQPTARLFDAVANCLASGLESAIRPNEDEPALPLYQPDSLGQVALSHAVRIAPVRSRGGILCLIEVIDMSAARVRERKLLEHANTLREQNYVDGLTGIANRRCFEKTLDQELRRAMRGTGQLSLLLFDVDSFKAYNDYFGHVQGDECLINVAQCVSAKVKRPGDLVARYGGEEFAVILQGTGSDHAAAYAEQIRASVEALSLDHSPAAGRAYVTVSIGVASFNRELYSSPLLLKEAADAALYRAKREGRNRVVVSLPDSRCAV